MTVSRPGGLAASSPSAERGPRIPGWAKVVAVVVAVLLVAVGNVAAKRRADRLELAAQDRVALSTTMTSNVTEFGVQLILLFRNSGRSVRLLTPTVSAPGFTVTREDTPFPLDVAAGGTRAVALHLGAQCSDGHLVGRPPADARLLLPAVPPSGKPHTMSVPFAVPSLTVLGEQACGFVTADRSVVPSWGDVVLERYGVTFSLALQNKAAESVDLEGLLGPSLAMSVRGGLPIRIAAADELAATARVTIPTCGLLPAELDPARRATAYAPFSLELMFEHGRRLTLPVLLLPDDPLLKAIRSLAGSICPPGSYRSGATGRRGGGVR